MSREAEALALTSILVCGAIGATDKLRAKKVIARCDHTRRDFVNARSVIRLIRKGRSGRRTGESGFVKLPTCDTP